MTNFDYPEIAVILYDDLPDECKSIKANLVDLTDFKLNGHYKLNVTMSKNIDQALTDASDQGYQWAMVVAAGNFLQDQTLLLQTIEHARTENAALACHILDRGGYYHFHPQWFALDLECYKKIGRPTLLQTAGPVLLTTCPTARCPDNVHDDYTPWWLKPEGTELTQYESDQGYFGLRLIADLIQHGYKITNIPESIRNRKNYCYPHNHANDIQRLICRENFEPSSPPLWWFKHAIDQLTAGLNTGYYLLNTETLSPDSKLDALNFDAFVGVCGGIKPACIAGQPNFAADSKVVLVDISQAALDYQQWLVTHWDGDFDKFQTVWKEFKTAYPSYSAIYLTHKSIDENIDWFLQSADMTRAEFRALWQHYLGMQHAFVKLDLLQADAADQLLNLLGDRQCSYVWTSNAFIMDYLMFYRTRQWCLTHSEQFAKTLANKKTGKLVLENCGAVWIYD